MNLIEKLKQLTADAEKNADLFYNKGNKTAGVRLRKNALDIKNLTSEIRKDVSDVKNSGKE